jgi:hypothetical protein
MYLNEARIQQYKNTIKRESDPLTKDNAIELKKLEPYGEMIDLSSPI